MKKTLAIVLALVFVLSIAGTAFAASNPFVDVPAKHWAYDAVSKLAKAGIVDGYGDGTFRGDKTMTRYEMAQIVAKAMAKSDKADAANKALVDKLAVEFAAELNNLGVRVAKLEANASSIKFSGDARVRYINKHDGGEKTLAERFRLNMTSNVNENTSFYGRFFFGHWTQGTNPTLQLTDAAFTTKDVFGSGLTLTLGRQSQQVGVTGYLLGTTGMVDAAKLGFNFDKALLEFGYGDFSNATATIAKAFYATLKYPTSNATTFVLGAVQEKTGTVDFKVMDIGVTTKLSKDFALTAEYAVNTAVTNDPKFTLYRLSYKGANAKVQGTYGVFVEYYKAQAGSLPAGGEFQGTSAVNAASNKKAVNFVYTTTIAKNIVLDAIQTFNTKNATTGAEMDNYTRVQVNYMF